MILALDPDVCVAASLGHPDSEGLLDDIYRYRDYVRIGLDREQDIIQKDLERILPGLRENSRKWLTWLLESQKLHTTKLSAPKAYEEAEWLHDLGCGTPVEPHLIALCAERGREAPLLVVGPEFTSAQLRRRGVHDPIIVSQLEARYGILRVWPAVRARRALADWIRSRSPYPCTELELQDYLRQHKYQEGDQLEFKQPISRDLRSILRDAMKSLCALANSYGGKVLVGVTPEGRIEGFEPIYNGQRRSDDELYQILASNPYILGGMNPRFDPSEVRYRFINLANGRKVLVFHVEKCRQKRNYCGKRYYRCGTVNIDP